MPPLRVVDHMGWHDQGDGRWYLGIPVESGRIRDGDEQHLRSGLREVIAKFGCNPILMPSQDILLSDIAPEMRASIERELRNYGITLASDITPVRRWALACPALPTCGLALTEAERVQQPLVANIEAVLERYGLANFRLDALPDMNDALLRSYRRTVLHLERMTSRLGAAEVAPHPPQDLARLREEQQCAAEAAAKAELALVEKVRGARELLAPEWALAPGAEIAQRLPPDTALLSVTAHIDTLIVWFGVRDGLWVELVDTEDGAPLRVGRLLAKVRAWVSALIERRRGIDEPLAARLLKPFDEPLAAVRRVIVVTDPAMAAVPLHAFTWRGFPLGLQREVVYLHSAQLVPHPRDEPVIQKSLVVVGGPRRMAMPDSATGKLAPLRPLPAAYVEAQLVAAAHGVRAHIGEAVTLQAVTQALTTRPALLHLATHGVLVPDAPLESAVVLAGGDCLRIEDIVALRLHQALVVLSGCDTGRGRAQGGELVGLARALLLAGARAVVASQWSVADTATALLMSELHRRLAAGEPVGAALRHAQRWLRVLSAEQAIRRLDESAHSTGSDDGDPTLAAYLLCCRADIFDATGDTRTAATFEEAAATFDALGLAQEAEDAHRRAAVSTLRALEPRPRRPRPFVAPFFWAPFILMGDWSMALAPNCATTRP